MSDTEIALLDAQPLPVLRGMLAQSVGANRNLDQSCRLRAQNDREAVIAWLANVAESAHTRESYLREVDRLYRWAALRGATLSDLRHEDFVLYRGFLANPQPAAFWVSAYRHRRSHPDWRPFTGPLSESSIRLSMSVLNALFSWLVEARYLCSNPLTLARKQRQRGDRRITRLLSEAQIQTVFAVLAAQPCDTPQTERTVARNRWLLTLALLTGLRVSEIVETRMSQLYALPNRSGKLCWYVDVLGKGSKHRQVPVNSELMAALADYRRGLGLPDTPATNEYLPLVCKVKPLKGGGLDTAPMTRQAAHIILKQLFRQAAGYLRDHGRPDEAGALEAASAHWLRHTAASWMASSGQSIHSVKDTLGHADLSTTSRYLHTELDARHQDMEKLRIGRG